HPTKIKPNDPQKIQAEIVPGSRAYRGEQRDNPAGGFGSINNSPAADRESRRGRVGRCKFLRIKSAGSLSVEAEDGPAIHRSGRSHPCASLGCPQIEGGWEKIGR